MEHSQTYIELMVASLKEKSDILDELVVLTKKQGECIRGKRADTPAYEELYEKKDKMIQALVDADEGFEKLYQRVKEELDRNRENYKEQIRTMQELIRCLTDSGVELQAMELRNKEAMEEYLREERDTIRQFNNNNKAMGMYYQNMANRPKQEQSFFYDKKK